MKTTLLTSITLTAVLVLPGCSSVNDGEYLGEALAALEGTVVNEKTEVPGAAEVTLIWGTSAADEIFYSDTVRVAGSFPASFTLEIFTPPPDEFLKEIPGTDGNRASLADITAWVEGQTPDTEFPTIQVPDSGIIPGFLGLDNDHVIMYLERDLPAGVVSNLFFEHSDGFLSEGLSAGVHVLEIVRFGTPGCTEIYEGEMVDCLRPAADGVDSELSVTLVDTIFDLEDTLLQ